MHMLRNALDRYLRMLAKKVEGIRGRSGIELLGDELGLLLRSLLIHAHAAVDDRQVVVCRQVIRVDLLQRLKLLSRCSVVMLAIKGEAKIAPSIARLRELLDHLFRLAVSAS